MIIGKAIERVQGLYSKGVDTDDSRLSNRHIYNKLLTVRSKLMVQRLRKNQPLSEWDLQPLHCIEMIPQTSLSCGGDNKCPFYKSKYKLPLGISPDETENVAVTSFDGLVIFNRTTFETYKYLNGNKYTSNKAYYFIHDSYIYVINSKIKSLHIHGIWRDPIEVWRLHLSYQNKNTCFNNKTIEFFTPDDMIEAMIEISYNELIAQFNQSRMDVTNNSNNSLLEESK